MVRPTKVRPAASRDSPLSVQSDAMARASPLLNATAKRLARLRIASRSPLSSTPPSVPGPVFTGGSCACTLNASVAATPAKTVSANKHRLMVILHICRTEWHGEPLLPPKLAAALKLTIARDLKPPLARGDYS